MISKAGTRIQLLIYDLDWQLQRVLFAPSQPDLLGMFTKEDSLLGIISSYITYSRRNNSKVTIPLEGFGLSAMYIKANEIEDILWSEAIRVQEMEDNAAKGKKADVMRIIKLNREIRTTLYGKQKRYKVTIIKPKGKPHVIISNSLMGITAKSGLSSECINYYDEILKPLQQIIPLDRIYPEGTKISVEVSKYERKSRFTKKKNEYEVTLVRKDTGEVFKEYKCNTLKMVVYRTGVVRGRLQEYYNGYAELDKSKVKSIQKEIESHGLLLCINVRPV